MEERGTFVKSIAIFCCFLICLKPVSALKYSRFLTELVELIVSESYKEVTLVRKEYRLAEYRRLIEMTMNKINLLSVVSLSRRFDVLKATLRQNLQPLNKRSLILRTHDGALSTNVLPKFSFLVCQQPPATWKVRLGQAAHLGLKMGMGVFRLPPPPLKPYCLPF